MLEILLAVLIVQEEVAPQEPPPPEIIVEGEKPKDPKRRICRRSVETGSIMPKVTCRSEEDWDEISKRSAAALERLSAERQARQTVQDTRDNN